jgi:23S rRNA pseudouridine1911/1915/1917 synthase
MDLPPLTSGDKWVWVPFEVDKRFDGDRVDQFLARRLVAYSRSRVQKILQESRVLRGTQPLKASTRVRGGDRILIAYPHHPEEPLAEDAAMPVLFEDEALIVVNKPADLLSHPTDKVEKHTVLGVLRHCRPDLKQLHLLHRLDRETSGVLTLAKTSLAARSWTSHMEARKIKKEYIAIVRGKPRLKEGILDRPIGRQGEEIKVRQWVDTADAVPAITRYKVMSSSKTCSVVKAFPETGRLHQIRVHFAALGHPLLGDVLYNGDGALYLKMVYRKLVPSDRDSLGFPRLALHAARIVFPHPINGRETAVEAPLPSDLSSFLENSGMVKTGTLTRRETK